MFRPGSEGCGRMEDEHACDHIAGNCVRCTQSSGAEISSRSIAGEPLQKIVAIRP